MPLRPPDSHWLIGGGAYMASLDQKLLTFEHRHEYERGAAHHSFPLR
jgi:hypothetical protein